MVRSWPLCRDQIPEPPPCNSPTLPAALGIPAVGRESKPLKEAQRVSNLPQTVTCLWFVASEIDGGTGELCQHRVRASRADRIDLTPLIEYMFVPNKCAA